MTELKINNSESSLKVVFTKDHLKSKSFWLGFAFVVIFISLLTVPSISFFYFNSLNTDSLFSSHGVIKNNYPLLYNKIGELLPWVVVCITALIVINGNTIFYFLTFNEDLIEEKFQTKKFWFNITTWLFIIWGIISAVYLVKFNNRFNDLTILLSKAADGGTSDKSIIVSTSNIFNHFIQQVETYTIITISIFILIDILSRVIKGKQINSVSSSLSQETDETKKKSFTQTLKKLELQGEFVSNQLFLIDIPVLIGIMLISLFTSHISQTIGNDMDEKYVFIAGGIGMHLIMSQVIFLILNLRYKFNEYKIDLTDKPQEKKEKAKQP